MGLSVDTVTLGRYLGVGGNRDFRISEDMLKYIEFRSGSISLPTVSIANSNRNRTRPSQIIAANNIVIARFGNVKRLVTGIKRTM